MSEKKSIIKDKSFGFAIRIVFYINTWLKQKRNMF